MRDGSQAPRRWLGQAGQHGCRAPVDCCRPPLLASRRVGHGSRAAGGRSPCLLPEGPFVFWRS